MNSKQLKEKAAYWERWFYALSDGFKPFLYKISVVTKVEVGGTTEVRNEFSVCNLPCGDSLMTRECLIPESATSVLIAKVSNVEFDTMLKQFRSFVLSLSKRQLVYIVKYFAFPRCFYTRDIDIQQFKEYKLRDVCRRLNLVMDSRVSVDKVLVMQYSFPLDSFSEED